MVTHGFDWTIVFFGSDGGGNGRGVQIGDATAQGVKWSRAEFWFFWLLWGLTTC